MLDILHKIYEISADRLCYAESKNGALLAVSALIFFRVIDSTLNLPLTLKIPHYVSILFFSIAILICIVSFMAQLNIPKMMREKKHAKPKTSADFDNLLSTHVSK